jgi:pilus assembly protein CpaB
VLLCLALACGGLAASEVGGRVSEIETRVGPLVPVLTARAELRQGTRLEERDAARLLAVREVPARFAPGDALSSVVDAAGLRAAVSIPPGAYVTAGQLDAGDSEERGTGSLGPGERALDLTVAGGEALNRQEGGPGSRVDVLVTTEADSGGGRTYVALENAQLLSLQAGDSSGSQAAGEGAAARGGDGTVATLRVTTRQAVYLTAAQNFAREIRLLARAPSDRRRAGRTSVEAGQL